MGCREEAVDQARLSVAVCSTLIFHIPNTLVSSGTSVRSVLEVSTLANPVAAGPQLTWL